MALARPLFVGFSSACKQAREGGDLEVSVLVPGRTRGGQRPLGVKLKSYTPLAYAALGGTAADLLAGYSACTAQREELRAATEEVKRAQEARSSQKAAEE